MGDYLGATICITELAILSTVNFMPKVSSLEHFVSNTINMDIEQWRTQFKWPPALGSEAVVVVRLVVVLSIVYLWSVAIQTWNVVKVRRVKAKEEEESKIATIKEDDNIGTQTSDGDFSTQEEGYDPCRNPRQRNHHNEHRGDHKFVRQGIQKSSDRTDQVPLSCEIAIDDVGDHGRRENGACHNA